MALVPEMSPEVTELLSAAAEDVNLAESVCDFLDSGLPFVVADVDGFPADATGNGVFTYQLSEPLKVLLAAARAGNLDSVGVPVGNGHDASP